MSAATSVDWAHGHANAVELSLRRSAAPERPRFSATHAILTKREVAEAVGVSVRTLDKHLASAECCAAIGAYKTSAGRNAHWRFPSSAPARLQDYLQTRKAA